MPSGPNTITAWVERLYEKNMYWSELYDALDREGVEYTINSVKRAVYLCGFKLRKFDAAEFIKDRYKVGMSIDTIEEICRLERGKIYAAIKKLGYGRPKPRYLMSETELLNDLMLRELNNAV